MLVINSDEHHDHDDHNTIIKMKKIKEKRRRKKCRKQKSNNFSSVENDAVDSKNTESEKMIDHILNNTAAATVVEKASDSSKPLLGEFGLPHQELESLENDLAFNLPISSASISS